jgi:hypothetical protein
MRKDCKERSNIRNPCLVSSYIFYSPYFVLLNVRLFVLFYSADFHLDRNDVCIWLLLYVFSMRCSLKDKEKAYFTSIVPTEARRNDTDLFWRRQLFFRFIASLSSIHLGGFCHCFFSWNHIFRMWSSERQWLSNSDGNNKRKVRLSFSYMTRKQFFLVRKPQEFLLALSSPTLYLFFKILFGLEMSEVLLCFRLQLMMMRKSTI